MGGSPSPLVLVVEDNAETADVLRRILVLRGYQVVVAWDGVDALEMLRDGLRPAAIVLDIAMPNVDGRAFRSALLAMPAFADIPVVVYTAVAGTDDLPGVVGHVRKGFDNPDVLLGFLDTACARGRRSPAIRSRSSS
jgi:two-component system, chemotaxis family, chemotaxis protein CheY